MYKQICPSRRGKKKSAVVILRFPGRKAEGSFYLILN